MNFIVKSMRAISWPTQWRYWRTLPIRENAVKCTQQIGWQRYERRVTTRDSFRLRITPVTSSLGDGTKRLRAPVLTTLVHRTKISSVDGRFVADNPLEENQLSADHHWHFLRSFMTKFTTMHRMESAAAELKKFMQ